MDRPLFRTIRRSGNPMRERPSGTPQMGVSFDYRPWLVFDVSERLCQVKPIHATMIAVVSHKSDACFFLCQSVPSLVRTSAARDALPWQLSHMRRLLPTRLPKLFLEPDWAVGRIRCPSLRARGIIKFTEPISSTRAAGNFPFPKSSENRKITPLSITSITLEPTRHLLV